MSTAELKYNLHQLIDKADSRTLNLIYLLLSRKASKKADWWDSISASEKVAIEEGLKDIEAGNTLSHEKVMEEIKAEFPGIFK